jgi:flagellar hook-basal body complex protein FliE
MNINSLNNASGDIISLKVTDKKHISDSIQKGDALNGVKTGDPVASTFADMMNKMIGETNDLELKSTDLANQMAVNPGSVNVEDVQIAAEEAEMAVLFTKGIVDRVIRAYKEITSLR